MLLASMSQRDEKADELKAAIAGLEAQRALLGDSVVEPALAALRQQLAELVTSSDQAADEERKIVTIMFVDVSGFTALSEKLDPEEVRVLINACFEQLVPIVQKYEGTIDKFIGDEIMALFGAPVAHENDPERAMRAALEMMDAISSFNRQHGTELGVHFGINTGPVVTGKIGSQARRDYSVMGDAVNLAARLEDASSTGEIFVGSNTCRQTSSLFDFEELSSMALKGKERPVQIYRLIGLKASPKPTRGLEGLRAPLVGRDNQLEEIQSILGAVRKGNGSILAVVGEAGLGKSRLVAEAQQSFATGIMWAEGRALSYTAGMSYWMARDILLALLGVKANSLPEKIEAALRRSVDAVLPERVADIYPYLGRLLEVPLEDAIEERVNFLTSEALQGRILQVFQSYVRARADREPLVLFWEDLHWCDPSSLRVLEILLPLTKEVPLVLLLAYRPDQDLLLQLQSKGRVIELSPLTRDQGGSLMQSLLKIENPKIRDLILDRAEGNPFFLEELLRSLLDAGVIILEEDRVVVARPLESVDVPETLQGVLMARIDRLAPEKKRTLQNASVIGRVFQQQVLIHLYNENGDTKKRLDDSLIELQRREFIQFAAEQSSEDREYIFKHAITHDVAYNSLLKARRKELHKLAAEAIEALFPDRLDELSATLGYHFARAEGHEKAIRYLRTAGQRAEATFANSEALAFYRLALEQVQFLRAKKASESLEHEAAQFEESIGDIESLIGRHEQARAAYESSLGRLAQHEVIWPSRLHRKTAKTWILGRQYPEAEQSYQKAEIVLQSRRSATREWQQEWLQIQLDHMWLHYWRGQVDEIAALAERIRPLIEKHATPAQRGKFFQNLTLMALRRDRYTADEETIGNAQASLLAIEESKVLPEIGHAHFVFGFTYLWAGKFDPAGEWLRNALKVAEQTGDIVLQSRCLTYLTVVHRRRGEVEAARHHAGQSLSLASTARMPEYIGMAKGNLAWVHLREGDFETAYQEACEGEERLRETSQSQILLWITLWPLVGAALARERIAEAIPHVETLLAPTQMAMPAALETELRRGLEAWKVNKQNKAKLHFKKVTDLAQQLGYI